MDKVKDCGDSLCQNFHPRYRRMKTGITRYENIKSFKANGVSSVVYPEISTRKIFNTNIIHGKYGYPMALNGKEDTAIF